MLYDRGYKVGKNDLEKTYDQFKTEHGVGVQRSNLDLQTVHNDDETKIIQLLFGYGPKLSKKGLEEVYLDIQGISNISAIVVVKDGATPQVKRAAVRCNVEIFLDKELMFNVTKHEIQPKFETMDLEEKKKLLKQYSIKDSQLPRMLKSDPIARYYGLKRRDVIRIMKDKLSTKEKYFTYRMVW